MQLGGGGIPAGGILQSTCWLSALTVQPGGGVQVIDEPLTVQLGGDIPAGGAPQVTVLVAAFGVHPAGGAGGVDPAGGIPGVAMPMAEFSLSMAASAEIEVPSALVTSRLFAATFVPMSTTAACAAAAMRFGSTDFVPMAMLLVPLDFPSITPDLTISPEMALMTAPVESVVKLVPEPPTVLVTFLTNSPKASLAFTTAGALAASTGVLNGSTLEGRPKFNALTTEDLTALSWVASTLAKPPGAENAAPLVIIVVKGFTLMVRLPKEKSFALGLALWAAAAPLAAVAVIIVSRGITGASPVTASVPPVATILIGNTTPAGMVMEYFALLSDVALPVKFTVLPLASYTVIVAPVTGPSPTLPSTAIF